MGDRDLPKFSLWERPLLLKNRAHGPEFFCAMHDGDGLAAVYGSTRERKDIGAAIYRLTVEDCTRERSVGANRLTVQETSSLQSCSTRWPGSMS